MSFVVHRPLPSARRGFTLAELVISLAVFALAATVLSQATFNALLALNQSQTSDESIIDYAFTRQQVLSIMDRELIDQGGEVNTPGGNKIRWQAELHSTGVLDFHLLELTFQRQSDSDPEQPHIEQYYLLRPSWSDAEERAAMVTLKQEEMERRRAFAGEEEPDA